MSRAYERKGIWYTDLIYPSGKRVRTKFGTSKKLAEAAVHEFELQKQRGKLDIVESRPILISDFFDYCLKHYQNNLDPKSAGRYSQHIKNFTGWLSVAHPSISFLGDLTHDIIEAYKIDSKTKRKYVTVNGEIVFLKQCFKLFKKLKKITENPAETVKLFNKDRIDDQKVHIILTPEQKKCILSHLKGIYHSIIFTLMHTGLRRGEIVNLEWADVDLNNSTINIPTLKGKKGHGRTVPINGDLKPVLAALPKTSTYVFPSTTGPHRLKEGLVNKHLIGAGLKCGLTQKKMEGGKWTGAYLGLTKPHDLRHTFISELVNIHKVPIPIVQKIVGHKNLATTMVYLHAQDEQMREAVGKIKF